MLIKFDIPDAPAPTDPFVEYWGKQIFTGHFSDDPLVVTLTSTYVRCVFAAREDYLATAEHLRSVWAPDPNRAIKVSELYRSIARFESCITGMYLAVRSMRELRKRQNLSPRERAVICEWKPKPRYLGSAGELLGKMRNKTGTSGGLDGPGSETQRVRRDFLWRPPLSHRDSKNSSARRRSSTRSKPVGKQMPIALRTGMWLLTFA
jgi:hypothetical protein